MTITRNEDQNDQNATSSPDGSRLSPGSSGRLYEIQVKGHLDSQWSDWLEGIQIETLDEGDTLLTGNIVDQAALMGILNKLNRLNLAILSVNVVEKK